jgi:hypothetical protein
MGSSTLQTGAPGAEDVRNMRTLGFRTHVLLAIAAAVGLVAALSRPWYAAAPAAKESGDKGIGDIHGPLSSFFEGVERWATESAGTTAWSGLDHIAIAIAAMAALAGLGALASLAPRLQALGREAVRYGSFVVVALVVWKLLDPPGDNGATELRWGAFVALGCALVLVSCGAEVCNSPLRGRRKPAPYKAPPPPVVAAYETHGSSAPPGA